MELHLSCTKPTMYNPNILHENFSRPLTRITAFFLFPLYTCFDILRLLAKSQFLLAWMEISKISPGIGLVIYHVDCHMLSLGHTGLKNLKMIQMYIWLHNITQKGSCNLLSLWDSALSKLTHCCLVRSYGDRDLWTLPKVKTCCLTTPSNYLMQCWFIISEVQRHSSKDNLTRYSQVPLKSLKLARKYLSKISFKSPTGQRVNTITLASSTIQLNTV